MSNDPLAQLEEWAAPLLSKLTKAEQAKLSRAVAFQLLRSQRARIRAGKNPDGTPYAPRKPQQDRIKNKPIRFKYDGDWSGRSTDAHREVKSYRDEGDRVTGYDLTAGAIRTFMKKGMSDFTAPTSTVSGSIRERRGQIRRMFDKVGKKMEIIPEPNGVAVGFVDRTARIARIHQFGLSDNVRPNVRVRYPVRQLLGFTNDDIDTIRNMLIEHLASKD